MNRTADNVLRQLAGLLKGDTLALMLFGSKARGDDNDLSDTDILQVRTEFGESYKTGRFAVSVYTPESLVDAAERGSLFILHLKIEGVILSDSTGILANCIAQYIVPSSYEPFLADLRIASNLLNISDSFYQSKWRQCNHLALFVLRSSLFARAAANGRPTFSIAAISAIENDYRILQAHQINYSTKSDISAFRRCASLAMEYLNTSFIAPLDSAQAISLGTYGHSNMAIALASRLLGTIDVAAYEQGHG